jgi:homoserine O-succinyltransferase/O-acetyltransferase
MPVTIQRPALPAETRISDISERRRRRGTVRDRGRRVVIGLVNNMPDAALAATERQFSGALETASGEIEVELRLFALPQVPRSPEALEHVARLYADASALGGESLDALIVTGAQPVAADLTEEPYWRGLTRVIDWAAANTISTILSCLAAHAGVRHFSAIARRALPKKCSGVFAFERVRADRLTEGAGGPWIVPHSRYNGLDEQDLTRHGYAVLTRSPEAGVDMFVREMRSLIVFLQGHPEYEPDTLAREYRRDVGRRLGGEVAALPEMPRDYFCAEAERVLREFCSRALAERRPEVMSAYPEIGLRGAAEPPWRRSTILFYRNWLGLIADRKAEAEQKASSLAARWGG